MTSIAPFAVKFESQDLEKEHSPDTSRPPTSNLLENVIDDIVNQVQNR